MGGSFFAVVVIRSHNKRATRNPDHVFRWRATGWLESWVPNGLGRRDWR
jgi:hypothetical protein